MLRVNKENLVKELRHLKMLYYKYSSDEVMEKFLVGEMNRVKQELRKFEK